MSRKTPDLPDTDEGHTERLRRAARRTQAVLNSGLAQSPLAPTLGMVFHLTVQENKETGEKAITELRRHHIDRPLLDQAATLTRVFTLGRETIHGPKVAQSIAHFAATDHQKALADQLKRMWKTQPFPRTYMMKSIGGTSVTPTGGLSDSTIGDRVLYSELVHADDASAVLEHVDDDEREWALSCLVGDRVALISHQEWLINAVRPDVCPSPTPWAGDHVTIFRRLGARNKSEETGEEEGDQAEVANAEAPEPRDGTSNHQNEDLSGTQH